MKKIQLTVILFCILNVCCFAKEKKQNINIVFIGNSITQGAIIKNPAQDAPPAKVVSFLQTQPNIATIQFANCGISGCTTLDYLPATNTLFPKARTEADRFASDKSTPLIFSISLGTNDSAIKGPNGSPVSPRQYQTNLQVIISRLLDLYPGCLVVVHRPLWYSPNTYNGAMYLQEGLNRLQSYLPEIETLVAAYSQSNPGQVWMGDREGYDYFKTHYLTDLFAENGNAGTFYLHPNEKGATKLGEFWGKAILRIIPPK